MMALTVQVQDLEEVAVDQDYKTPRDSVTIKREGIFKIEEELNLHWHEVYPFREKEESMNIQNGD